MASGSSHCSKMGSGAGGRHQAVGLPAKGDALLGAFEGAGEAGIVEGLEEIVEGAGVKGFERILIVGRHEDDGGWGVSA